MKISRKTISQPISSYLVIGDGLLNPTLQLMTAFALLAIAASGCARKQQAALPTPPPAGAGATDARFEDDAAYDDAFAEDPGVEGDLTAFEQDSGFAEDPSPASVGEATPTGPSPEDQARAQAKAQQIAMLVQSLPAMMQAVSTGNPQALMPMFGQMMASQGGTGGQIMSAAMPLMQQAMMSGGGRAPQQQQYEGE